MENRTFLKISELDVIEITNKLKNKEMLEEFINTSFIDVGTWNMQINAKLKN